jgi:bacillithiol system protein YtxJ
MIKQLTSSEQLMDLLSATTDRRLFIFKHSIRCPISARAFEEYQTFSNLHPSIDCYYVDVLNNREVSNVLTQTCHVKHESPQVILFRNGRPEWSATHYAITVEALESHFRNNSKS